MTVAARQRNVVLPAPGEWSEFGACTSPEVNREIFFTEGNTDSDKTYLAYMVCSTCDVQFDCLLYACGSNFITGTWGATTQSKRQRLRFNVEKLRRAAQENIVKAFRFYDRKENREKLSGIFLRIFHEKRGEYLNDRRVH